MPAKIYLDEPRQEELKLLFHSDLGIKEVCSTFGNSYTVVMRYWKQWFTEAEFSERCSRLNRIHKVGNKNPMYGICGPKHHGAKDVVLSTQGYRQIWAPEWYTGSADGNRALEHIVVWCKQHGFSEVPRGYVVHHLDHDRLNNEPSNLLLMTIADHLAYHNTKSKERATTILNRSREKALPKRPPSL